MARLFWDEYKNVVSSTHVADLVPHAAHVPPGDLVELETYRRDERKQACNGNDPIRIVVAYAQNNLLYNEKGIPVPAASPEAYDAAPRGRRVNVFGHAYRPGTKLYLHKNLADIVVDSAIHLHNTQGWTTIVYDGLRTVEGTFKLYNLATEEDIKSGLLAKPGESAHNKGMAVDSMMIDRSGREVDMGGHFDHADMVTNSRAYSGGNISDAAKKNRLIRESAALRAAFKNQRLIAPLRTEFWDDRPPEDRTDLWRVLDSAARCMGKTLYTPEDSELRKTNRAAWKQKWESWSYDDFLAKWQELFKGREAELVEKFGVATPPAQEKLEFYHGNYHPIYDRDLLASGKNLT